MWKYALFKKLLGGGQESLTRYFRYVSPKLIQWVGGVRCSGLFPKKCRFFFTPSLSWLAGPTYTSPHRPHRRSGQNGLGVISPRCPATTPCPYPDGKCGRLVRISLPQFPLSQSPFNPYLPTRWDLGQVDESPHAQEGDTIENNLIMSSSILGEVIANSREGTSYDNST